MCPFRALSRHYPDLQAPEMLEFQPNDLKSSPKAGTGSSPSQAKERVIVLVCTPSLSDGEGWRFAEDVDRPWAWRVVCPVLCWRLLLGQNRAWSGEKVLGMGAGDKGEGAKNWEVGAGSWGEGTGDWEVGAEDWRLRPRSQHIPQPPPCATEKIQSCRGILNPRLDPGSPGQYVGASAR